MRYTFEHRLLQWHDDLLRVGAASTGQRLEGAADGHEARPLPRCGRLLIGRQGGRRTPIICARFLRPVHTDAPGKAGCRAERISEFEEVRFGRGQTAGIERVEEEEGNL